MFDMKIQRLMETAAKEAAKELPILTVLGPRQSGKTTFVKTLFPKKPYCSLEDPDTRALAESDPHKFFSKIPNGAILDEVQRVPDLLSYIQGIVDEKEENGFFILTGSCNPLLMKNVSQSLAGRCAIFTLLPFSMKEAVIAGAREDVNSTIFYGGYPRILAGRTRPETFFNGYIETYVQRDVKLLQNIKDTALFIKFIKLLASRIGSLLDITSLSDDCGISTKTVNEWLSILQTSYIIFLLQPWYENRGKRLTKTPKLYFYDTGLACALLEIDSPKELDKDRLRGGLFENLIVLEKMKQSYNAGKRPSLYFYRDARTEVDLVEHKNGKLFPTEIKSCATFHSDFCKNLDKFATLYQDMCTSPTVIYCGEEAFDFKGVTFTPFSSLR